MGYWIGKKKCAAFTWLWNLLQILPLTSLPPTFSPLTQSWLRLSFKPRALSLGLILTKMLRWNWVFHDEAYEDLWNQKKLGLTWVRLWEIMEKLFKPSTIKNFLIVLQNSTGWRWWSPPLDLFCKWTGLVLKRTQMQFSMWSNVLRLCRSIAQNSEMINLQLQQKFSVSCR